MPSPPNRHRKPPLVVVLDGLDHATLSAVADRHDLAAGVAVLDVVPGGTTRSSVAIDVLYALGKRPIGRDWPSSTIAARLRVDAWLRGEQVRMLMLQRGEIHDSARLRDFVAVARDAGATPILTFSDRDRARRAAKALQAEIGILPDPPARRRPHRPPAPTTVGEAPWTTAWIERAQAHAALAPDAFHALDARLHAAFSATSRWIGTVDRLDGDRLRHFATAITSTADEQEREVRAIGVRVALLRAGVLAAITLKPPATTPVVLDADADGDVRAHTDPAAAAALVLALAGLDALTAQGLTLDQLIDRGAEVKLAGYRFTGAAAAALRAQRALQLAETATPTTPLLTGADLRRWPRRRQPDEPPAPGNQANVTAVALESSLDGVSSPIALEDPDLPAPDAGEQLIGVLLRRLLRVAATATVPLSRMDTSSRATAERLVTDGLAFPLADGIRPTSELLFSSFLLTPARYFAELAHRRA